METTLSGEFVAFVAFVAEFSHADELGGELTSLIDDPRTHTLVREVEVDLLDRDGITDFLGKDTGQLSVYESNGLDTEVTDQCREEVAVASPSVIRPPRRASLPPLSIRPAQSVR